MLYGKGHFYGENVSLYWNLAKGTIAKATTVVGTRGYFTRTLLDTFKVGNVFLISGVQIRDPDNNYNFLWVEDFPLFLPSEDRIGELESTHHPFTAPVAEHTPLIYSAPQKVNVFVLFLMFSVTTCCLCVYTFDISLFFVI